MILLDTHVLVWLDEGNSNLGKLSRELIDKALHEDSLAVTAISFWEITMLAEKKRLEIDMDLGTWRNELLENGLREIAMHGDIGIKAGSLLNFHGDPADRIIVASALSLPAKLITADEKILAWDGLQSKLNAKK